MLDERPSKLYDALSSILGLDQLVSVEKLLGDTAEPPTSTTRTRTRRCSRC